MPKVIVIGLDAVCFDIIRPWLDAGDLPVLAGLMAEGTFTPMSSRVPLHTAPAWTSIMTGVDIGEHGIFDYYELAAREYRPRYMNSTDVMVPYVWEMAGHHGLRSIVVNVPLTHPPRPFDGILIPGLMAPEDTVGYPAGILQELTTHIGEYRVYCPEEFDDSASLESKLAGFLRLSQMRRDAVLYLAQTHDWHLLVVQFQRTDSVFHVLNRVSGKDMNQVLALYQAIDTYIGEIVALAPEATVFVVSDHGIGLTEQMFAVNTWLKSMKYLQTQVDDKGQAFDPDGEMVRLMNAGRDSNSNSEGGTKSRVELALRALAGLGLTKQRLERVLRSLHLDGVVRRIVPYRLLKSQVGFENIDWEHSRAFCFHSSGGGVQINVAGREPAGTVEPGPEYERLREELVASLSALQDPQGRPVFSWVKKREDAYQGPAVESIPDIVFLPTDARYKIEKRIRGGVFIANQTYYSHKIDGILIAKGPHIRQGAWSCTKKPDILHVAPLLLCGLGIPADTNMAHAPLLDIFTPEYVSLLPKPVAYAVQPVRDMTHAGAVLDETEAAVLTERLRTLGYLD